MLSGHVQCIVQNGRRVCDPCEVLAVASAPGRRIWKSRPPAPTDRVDQTRRRETVADLYADGLTTYAIAKRLGFSQATIAKDIKALGISRPAYSAPRKYEAPVERECERGGCSVRFTPIACDVARGNGRFCSRPCAASAAARPRVKGENLICALPKCGRSFWVWDSQLRRADGKFGGYCSRECASKGLWVKNEGAGARGLVGSLENRGLWSLTATRRWSGRWGGHRGKFAGIEKGGRPSLATPEEQQAMFARSAEGLSSRAISAAVFGDERYYKRVQRFLNR